MSKLSLFLLRRRAAVPNSRVERQIHPHGQPVSPLDSVDENFGGHLPHFLHWNVHGGQHRRQILGHVDVIDADDGHIAWNGMTGFLQCPHDTDGSDVIGTEISSGVTALFQQFFCPLVTAFR